MKSEKRWQVAPALSAASDADLASFPAILRQVLYNRGIRTALAAREFLAARPGFDPDPFQLLGMETAVSRLDRALENHEQVAVYGDYDVDGVTATALLVEVLQALGGQARPFIPNRNEEGYGLNEESLTQLAREGVKLVVTVDCGIRSFPEIVRARQIGLDLIVTDHHQPGAGLPPALAVIDPRQEGDPYPDKDLAGVGVAYKLAQALLTRHPGSMDLSGLLDLVALGTVADLAPLTGENRSLVREGLARIRQPQRQGLFSLANVAGVTAATITASQIGFMLGPRLNAAGRLESAMAAYELLTTKDLSTAGRLAQKLDVQNRERQALTRRIQMEAEEMIQAAGPDAPLMFAVHPEFNSGVVGLAAARLVEMHYRPAVVGQVSAETTRCSCRSIPEFHITEALDRCSDLLIRHGGHAAAAGFTVANENLEELRARLTDLAAVELGDRDLRPTLPADVEVPLGGLTTSLLRALDDLQPTGHGNPEATFVSRGVDVLKARTVGAEAQHLKLTLSDGQVEMEAIAFRLGHHLDGLARKLDILYTFEENEYNGRRSLQLNIKDLQPSGQSA